MLDEVLNEFTRRCGPCCVAGGAVRDILMERKPKDYDVFLFEDVPPQALSGLTVVDALPFHTSEPFLQGTFEWRGAFVQVMRPEVNTVESLLKTFDWNTSLFAYDGRFTSLESTGNIAPGKPLVLHSLTFPVATLRRGFRFAERFQMEFKRDDILRICNEIAAKPTKV